jgi:hypothetical protein
MAIAFFEGNISEVQQFAQGVISHFKTLLPSAINEGHIKALAKTPIPEPRAEDYRALRWFIYKSERPLVLGDVGCLFETAGERRFKSLNEKDDEIRNIYLPIMSNRILIGTAFSSTREVDFRPIEEAIVKCSREFFVCSESSRDRANLLPLIGTAAEIATENDLDQMMNEVVKAMTR